MYAEMAPWPGSIVRAIVRAIDVPERQQEASGALTSLMPRRRFSRAKNKRVGKQCVGQVGQRFLFRA